MVELIPVAGATVFIGVLAIVLGLSFLGIDRFLVARMQARIGPPLRQPFLDTIKLMAKENLCPENAIPWLFHGAPIAAVASSITILLYIPLIGLQPVLGDRGDVVLVLYLLAVPSLAMVVGGFASGSPYATIGSQREMVTMISYELPLATTVMAFAWKLTQAGVNQPFSLTSISQNPVWEISGPIGIAGFILLLGSTLVVTPAELGKVPFDSPEAETELAGGLLVEYSGRNLAMFFVSQGVRGLVVASLVVALFFPYNLSPIFDLPESVVVPIAQKQLWPLLIDAGFYFAKMATVMFFAVSLIRITMARFRINQVVTIYWKIIGLAGFMGLILVMIDAGR